MCELRCCAIVYISTEIDTQKCSLSEMFVFGRRNNTTAKTNQIDGNFDSSLKFFFN